MGDGVDIEGGAYAESPQSGWGPPEQPMQDPRYMQQPQYQQPQPQYAPPQQQYQQAPRRARRTSKVEARLRMVQYFEELLNAPIFNDPNDRYATTVQEEIYAFAQRRIDELFGEAPSKADSAFSPEQAAALKMLADKLLAPEDESSPERETSAIEARPLPTPATSSPPSSPVREIRGCGTPGCGFAEHGSEHPHGQPLGASPVQPRQRPLAPLQAPTQQQVAPAAPQVIARPSAAQRAALEASRQPQAPQQAPNYVGPAPVSPAQMINHPMARTVGPAPQPTQPQRIPGRRGPGKKGKAQAEPATPARAFAPPPLRYSMPQGQAMTAVTAMKAQECIEKMGVVQSETFVTSRG